MKRAFYPTSILLLFGLGLVACGDSPTEQLRDDSQFQLAEVFPAYEPIGEGGIEERLISKLRNGSKEALRFAKEALGERGDDVVPALVQGLQSELDSGTTAATNFLSALVFTRTKQPLPILIEVLERHPLPLVRSQALDSIALLKQSDLEEAVIAFAEFEVESGPRARIVPCLGALGGEASVEYLASLIGDWQDGGRIQPLGSAAWEQLLTIDSPAARAAIEGQLDSLPPAFRAAGVTRLIHLGDRSRLDQVRELLDASKYPAAKVRHHAVEGLAVAGDFDSVLGAFTDPNLQVKLAVIDAMRLEEAAQQGLGRDLLFETARGENEDLARAALHVLHDRGEGAPLEPWLALVRGYPNAPGSIGATRMFLHLEFGHPALTGILIQRWPFADADQRIDLGRVMAKHADERVIEFLQSVVMDESEDADVRLYSLTSLGNCGVESVPALLEIWESSPAPVTSERLISALLRYPEEEQVREFLTQLALDPDSPDFARAQALANLPKAYGLEAYELLMQAREAAQRDVVRLYIEQILHQYF